MYFPVEQKNTPVMQECINELSMASRSGFRSKQDDFLDNISQLAALTVWRPSETGDITDKKGNGIWELDDDDDGHHSALSSYVV